MSTIGKKFILLFVPLIIISCLFLSLISNHLFSSAIIKQTWNDISVSAGIISTQIQRNFVGASNCAKTIVRDLNYDENRNKLLIDNQSNLDLFETQNVIQNVLYDNSIFFPEVEYLAFVDIKGDLYELDKGMFSHWDRQAIDTYTQLLRATSSVDVWFPIEHLDSQSRILLGKKVMNMNNGYTLGYLFISFSDSLLKNYLISSDSRDGSFYCIIDQSGQYIASSSDWSWDINIPKVNIQEQIGCHESFQKVVNIDSNKMLLTVVSIGGTGLLLLNLQELKILTQPAYQLSFTVFGVCAVVLFLGVGLSSILTKRITDPLKALTKDVQMVQQGNFSIQTKIEGNDEIAQLSRGITIMLQRIDELFCNLAEEQQRKRTLELALLQSQIKPHFMYNTLDLIYVLCSMGKNDQAQEATKSLADFYRLALSDGREIISIGREIDHVENYMRLQKMRYSDAMTYNIDVDKSVRKFAIPKLTLQPLVENAIYHGIRLKPGGGTITVTGMIEDSDTVLLCVQDNGVGMTTERIRHVLENANEDSRHFGLHNVEERVRLYFPGRSNMTVRSILGGGTNISIKISGNEEVQDERSL